MHNQSLDQLLDMPVMSKEQASQTSNLQGGAHDPSDENKRQKIYLIKHVEIAIQVKEKAKHLLDHDRLKISTRWSSRPK